MGTMRRFASLKAFLLWVGLLVACVLAATSITSVQAQSQQPEYTSPVDPQTGPDPSPQADPVPEAMPLPPYSPVRQKSDCCGGCCGCCGACPQGDGGGRWTLPRCPGGYSPYDSYCLPSCPPSWVRYPGYPGFCLPPYRYGCPPGYEPVPLPYCPPGFHRDLQNPDQCLPDDVPSQPCPGGLVYSPWLGQCAPYCPQGTYLAENGVCRSVYLDNCPEGYTRNPQTGVCVPPGTWPVDYQWICLPTCPPGSVRNVFNPTICEPPVIECPAGSERYRDQCLPPCAPGSVRDQYGYCVPQGCPEGAYPGLDGQCREPACPPEYESVNGQCLPPCDQGTRRSETDPGQCVPDDDRPQCPEGTALNPQTGACERIITCPAGTSFNAATGKCEGRSTRPECAKGQFFNPKTKRCERLPRQAPTCPKGTEYNPNSRRCEAVFVPPPECPAGTVRVASGACVSIERPACRPNEVYNPQTRRCEPRRVQCGKGEVFNPKSGRCERQRQGRPDCGRSEVFNPQTGRCEPRRQGQQGADRCPAGMLWSSKRQRCEYPNFQGNVPRIDGNTGFNGKPSFGNDPPPPPLKQKGAGEVPYQQFQPLPGMVPKIVPMQ